MWRRTTPKRSLRCSTPSSRLGLYTTFLTPFTADYERAFIESFPARGLFLGAFENGELRGFQVVTPLASYTPALEHVAEIGTHVSLSRQRRGMARQLFNATREQARASGFEKLLAWVRADNAAGGRSYRKNGIAEVGVARRHAKVGGR